MEVSSVGSADCRGLLGLYGETEISHEPVKTFP